MFLRKRNQDARVIHIVSKYKKEESVKIIDANSVIKEDFEAPKKATQNRRKTKKEEIQETVENNEIENTEENGAN